jgi:hypothetical protein
MIATQLIAITNARNVCRHGGIGSVLGIALEPFVCGGAIQPAQEVLPIEVVLRLEISDGNAITGPYRTIASDQLVVTRQHRHGRSGGDWPLLDGMRGPLVSSRE